MSGYGLLSKQGADVRVSDKAIQILHPLGESEKMEAIRSAALSPPLFAELFKSHGACSAKIIEGKLVQSGYAPDSARKTAWVFGSNIEFAGLRDDMALVSTQGQSEVDEILDSPVTLLDPASPVRERPLTVDIPLAHVVTRPNAGNLVKEYRLPLDDESEVELKFYGPSFGMEQLDALLDLVEFLKKQYGRRKNIDSK
jgi:hypothetical protein